MSNEAFVALLDEAYKFIVSDFLERMLENTVSVLNTGWLKMNKKLWRVGGNRLQEVGN